MLTFGLLLQADAGPVDPKPAIEAACHGGCTKPWSDYQKCIKRIEEKGHGACEQWAMDYWKCIDKCVSATQEELPRCSH